MSVPLYGEDKDIRSQCGRRQDLRVQPFSLDKAGFDRVPYGRSLWLALLLVSVLGISGCQAGFFGAVNLTRGGGDTLAIRDIEFLPEHDLRLDIYRPEAPSADAPVVVFYYGGSWRNGSRSWYRFVGDSFARLGAVTVIADYRTFPDAPFPLFMDDAAAAVAWVQSHREQVGSTGPLLLAGHSAGAHIAALLATDRRYLETRGIAAEQVRGVIGLAGPYDFLPIESRKVREVFVDDAGARAAQPVRFVSPATPPFLMVHGLDDDLVWPRNSQSMAEHLTAVGQRAELLLLPDMGHIELIFALGKDNAVGRQLEQAIAGFLARMFHEPTTAAATRPGQSGHVVARFAPVCQLNVEQTTPSLPNGPRTAPRRALGGLATHVHETSGLKDQYQPVIFRACSRSRCSKASTN